MTYYLLLSLQDKLSADCLDIDPNDSEFAQYWKEDLNKWNKIWRKDLHYTRKWNQQIARILPSKFDMLRESIICNVHHITNNYAYNQGTWLNCKAETGDIYSLMPHSAGVLYCYLQLFKRDFPMQSYLTGFTPLPYPIIYFGRFAARERTILNLITLTANATDYRVWVCLIQRSRVHDQYWCRMAFILIDLGLFWRRNLRLFFRRACKCKSIIGKVVNAARRNPLSLQQMSRLTIRSSMRDIHILADCYTLPIPKTLRDYVSLKSLDAEIRPWYLHQKEEPSQVDLIDQVLVRYNIKPRRLQWHCLEPHTSCMQLHTSR